MRGQRNDKRWERQEIPEEHRVKELKPCWNLNSVCICLSVLLSVYVCLSVSVRMYACLCVCLFVSVSGSVCLSVWVSVCLLVCVCPYLCLSLGVCGICIYLDVCVCVCVWTPHSVKVGSAHSREEESPYSSDRTGGERTSQKLAHWIEVDTSSEGLGD